MSSQSSAPGDEGRLQELRQRADQDMLLRRSPKRFSDIVAMRRVIVAALLSSQRWEKYGIPHTGATMTKYWISTDYTGMGTAEFAAGELQDPSAQPSKTQVINR